MIVLDITMPRLDGIEAARQLRHSHRHARLVFLTVHDDADFAQAALDAGYCQMLCFGDGRILVEMID